MEPQVQTYDQIYGGLAGQYDPQTSLINTQLADLPRQQAAQQASLDQAKVNAFKDITNSANSKGVLFSGVPIDQQSTYVGTKYLPAVANMETGFNNNKTSLMGALNTVNSNRMNTARGIQAGQQSALTNYEKAQSDAAYKQAQLQLGYAKLGASNSRAAAKITPQQAKQNTALQITQGLRSVAGADKYVAPQDYATAYKDWLTAGYAPGEFNNFFGGFKNPNNGYYDYAISRG